MPFQYHLLFFSGQGEEQVGVGDLVDAGDEDDHHRGRGQPLVDGDLELVDEGQVLHAHLLRDREQQRLGERRAEAHHDRGDVQEQRDLEAGDREREHGADPTVRPPRKRGR